MCGECLTIMTTMQQCGHLSIVTVLQHCSMQTADVEMQYGSDLIDALYNVASAVRPAQCGYRTEHGAEMHFQHILAESGDQETTDHGVTSVWIQLQCVLYLSLLRIHHSSVITLQNQHHWIENNMTLPTIYLHTTHN